MALTNQPSAYRILKLAQKREEKFLKVNFIEMLKHFISNQLSLFTVTEEVETGANHVVETV